MSVLVKGMKMPKSCAACRFRTCDYESVDPFTDYCYLTNARLGRYDNDRAKWKRERRKGCPLLAVEDEKPTTRSCDRNICTENEYNGISCNECEVAKNYNLEDDDTPCLNCGVDDAP